MKFSITILLHSGAFEITESGSVVAKGFVREANNLKEEFLPLPQLEKVTNYQMNSSEIYAELDLRGYNYKGEFCGIKSSDDGGKY